MFNRKKKKITSEKDAVKLAWKAIKYTHQVLPRGSINKKSDDEKPDHMDIYHALTEMRKNRDNIIYKSMYVMSMQRTNVPRVLQKMYCKAALYKRFKAGNCEEQATVAYVYLNKLGVDDVDYVCMENGSHEFVLINGNIICDPWRDKVYHVKDFEKEREEAKNFIYSDFVYEEIPGIKPYLFGMPYVKFQLDDKRPLSIVDGQFVRSGIDNFKIDYSEYHQELGKAQSGSYRPSMK